MPDEQQPQSEEDTLALISAFAGWTGVEQRNLGQLLAEHIRDQLDDVDPHLRARVLLRAGQFITEVVRGSGDGSSQLWANVLLIAAAEQES